MSRERPKMYRELATWWPLLSRPEDYAEEAAIYREHLERAADRPIETLLELGSGGGNNALHLEPHFRLTLSDVSPEMLAVSRALLPECEHVEGDMRTLRLDRSFDAVFVHDAICYMTSEADLRAAILTAFEHCRPGGGAVFAPDFLRESFRPDTDHGGHDGPDRSLRYLEWTWDPDPDDTTYTVDYTFVLRDAEGNVHTESERHIEGLFTRAQWLQWLRETGFEAEVVVFEHSEVDYELELFSCRRPAE